VFCLISEYYLQYFNLKHCISFKDWTNASAEMKETEGTFGLTCLTIFVFITLKLTTKEAEVFIRENLRSNCDSTAYQKD
jgi:hypothetical protein